MTSSPPAPGARPDGAPAGLTPAAVVAAHGDLAAGLVSAVAQITGRGDLLVPLSNRGLGPAEIEAAMRAALDAGPVRAVFTDLQGGSCTMAARRLQRERPELSVATGVNLGTLLDFVCAVDARGAAGDGTAGDGTAGDGAAAATRADVARAVERGRGTLAAFAAPNAVPSTAPGAPPNAAPNAPPDTPPAGAAGGG